MDRLTTTMLIFAIVTVTLVLVNQPSYGASYFGGDNIGRPIPAFSICCCKKIDETSTQVHYGCNLNEENTCPQDTKPYSVQAQNCASELIFTRY